MLESKEVELCAHGQKKLQSPEESDTGMCLWDC